MDRRGFQRLAALDSPVHCPCSVNSRFDLLLVAALIVIAESEIWSSQSPSAAPDLIQPPLQGRHPRAHRRTLIDPIPTVLSQVTAACPVFP
jgi:hypothetical protein